MDPNTYGDIISIVTNAHKQELTLKDILNLIFYHEMCEAAFVAPIPNKMILSEFFTKVLSGQKSWILVDQMF